MLEWSVFHTYLRTKTFVPLVNCIIDDTSLETIPDINQALLSGIGVCYL